jgi:hypothetical protein
MLWNYPTITAVAAYLADTAETLTGHEIKP